MKIFLAGHSGLVGRSLHNLLKKNALNEIVTISSKDLDLTDQALVSKFFNQHSFDVIYVAAAHVGGIGANQNFPAEFIYKNTMIQSNIINSAHVHDVDKLLFLGSSCIYPKLTKQPIREEYLLSGSLEQTNSPYAIAKISGLSMCQSYNFQYGRDYRCLMPTNLYGRFDNFDLESSHVIPALIAKFHRAKAESNDTVTIWGTGNPKREFLHSDDLAAACIHFMSINKGEFYTRSEDNFQHINIGSGEEISIKDLAFKISKLIGYVGKIRFDNNQPDGVQQKLLDSSRAYKFGWKPEIDLDTGLKDTIKWYANNLGFSD